MSRFAPTPDWLRILFSVLIAAAVVAMPLFLLRALISERIALKQSVETTAAEGWGGLQTVAGPVLQIPLVSEGVRTGYVALLPVSLNAAVELDVQRRSRGLFEALIY